MCDLIITTYVLFVPEGRPKRKKQKEEWLSFFQRMKANKFVYLFCDVCMYEQSNNDIFEVQSIITNHN